MICLRGAPVAKPKSYWSSVLIAGKPATRANISRARARRDSRVLDVSLLGGFFCSERRETGISVVVTTNGEPNLARDIAEEIKDACWAKRQAFHTDMVSVAE